MAKQKSITKASSKRRASAKASTKNASASRPTRSSNTKRARAKAAVSAGDEEVALDRRRGTRRSGAERAATTETTASQPKLERREKVNRRRQIDPTTCERDYTEHEVEFMNALDDYKRKSGRMFPTCSEVLEVIRSLGYVKLSPVELTLLPGGSPSVASAKPMPNEWPPTLSPPVQADALNAAVHAAQPELVQL